MWSRLLAINNHREHRLRAEINRIHAQIRAQTGALEDIRRQGSRARSAGANIARKPVPEKQISYINCAANSTIFILPICSFKKRASAFRKKWKIRTNSAPNLRKR